MTTMNIALAVLFTALAIGNAALNSDSLGRNIITGTHSVASAAMFVLVFWDDSFSFLTWLITTVALASAIFLLSAGVTGEAFRLLRKAANESNKDKDAPKFKLRADL